MLETPLVAADPVGARSLCLYRGPLRPTVSPLPDAPPWCSTDSYVSLGVVDNDVFGNAVFSGPVFPLRLLSALPPGETASGFVTVLGGPNRLWLVLAQISPEVISAEVEFPNNPSQLMTVHDGVAFAAAPIKSEVRLERSTITLRTHDTAVQLQPQLSQKFGSAAPQLRRDDCLEPLPAGQSPTDATAARSAIVETIHFAFADVQQDQPSGSAFDDASGLPELLRKVRSGPFASDAKHVQVDVRAVAFTAPDRAVARLDLTNIPPLTDDVDVMFEDGAWKMSFASFCRLVSRTGAASCP